MCPSSSRFSISVVLASALSLGAACSGGDSLLPAASLIPEGTARAPLASADAGGSGGVSVTTKSIPEGYFDANIIVHVVNGRPSSTYVVQRAPEIGRVNGSDGVCQRALGLAPWSSADAPAPAFMSFVQPGETSPVMLTTSAAGEGTVAFEFKVPTVPAGTKFDVMFRLLNDLAAPTSIFLSSCFTVTVL